MSQQLSCRVCRCTDMQSCNPPCAWEPGQGDLCTTCYEIILRMREWLEEAHRPNFAALKREATSVAPATRAKRRGA